jgi:uncharacterized YigZ family protein
MPQVYSIPTSTLECETEVKKSRFIARATYVATRKAAMIFLEQVKADYPDARHHCWAYLVGNPSATCSAAMSDDGEPSGVAGKPILNVIQHKGIGDVVVVVTRYFGGIKLGAGGMVRAYSGAAEGVLSLLPLKRQRPLVCRQLSCDFSQEQSIRHWAEKHDTEVGEVLYSQCVDMALVMPAQHEAEFAEFCTARGIVIKTT